MRDCVHVVCSCCLFVLLFMLPACDHVVAYVCLCSCSMCTCCVCLCCIKMWGILRGSSICDPKLVRKVGHKSENTGFARPIVLLCRVTQSHMTLAIHRGKLTLSQNCLRTPLRTLSTVAPPPHARSLYTCPSSHPTLSLCKVTRQLSTYYASPHPSLLLTFVLTPFSLMLESALPSLLLKSPLLSLSC